jgi:3'(2'), 5'-bisphosphate nucleotidase
MKEQIKIEDILEIAKQAGEAILKIYDTNFQVDIKEDKSPLTQADKASNSIIVHALQEKYPAIPIISEENKQLPYSERKSWTYAWLVDPLDGTKEFIKHNGEFTVNIALILHGFPILGVIYIPAKNIMYYGVEGKGSFKSNGDGAYAKIQMAAPASETLKVVASRSHLNEDTEKYVDELKKKYKNVEYVSSGSSIKFCMVADGTAHEYPRFAPTMEWDTAAGQAIAEGAGARVTNMQTGKRLSYNKEKLLNDYFLVN